MRVKKQTLAVIFGFTFIASLLLLPVLHAHAAVSKLAYVEYDGGTTISLNAINSDGSSDSVLASNTGFGNGQFGMEWSPDGTKIAYTRSDSGGTQYNIFIMNADGSGQVQLTSDNISGAYGLSWSPDGTKIAFMSLGVGPTYTIYSINIDGTNRTQLTTSLVDIYPQWYASNKIAFVSFRDGNTEIYTMNADGSGQTNITNNANADGLLFSYLAFSVSPDGTKVMFSSDRSDPGITYEVYGMNIDGSSQTRLTTSNAGATSAFYNWDSSSSRVAYGSNNEDLAGGNSGYQIYTINADGSSRTQLTSVGGNIISSTGQFGGIRWSPDDSQIAFSSTRNGNLQVFLMNASGSSQAVLVLDFSFSPRWQPASSTPTPSPTPSSGSSSSAATLAQTGESHYWLTSTMLVLFGLGFIGLTKKLAER